MLDKIMLSITGESVTITNSLLIVGTSIILGILISVVYMKTNQKSNLSSGFSTTLIMLPVIISIIILLVGNNVARAFSLAGAFSIIRFRSAPGDPKDIAYIFFTLAIGLTCGMGYIAYGFLFTLIISAVMIGLHITKFTEPKDKTMQLKITIPEDLNYEGIFEDILNNYTNYYNIQRVRTW
ncbi:cell division protein FtsZ, partial [Terrisporobacter othiniensis]